MWWNDRSDARAGASDMSAGMAALAAQFGAGATSLLDDIDCDMRVTACPTEVRESLVTNWCARPSFLYEMRNIKQPTTTMMKNPFSEELIPRGPKRPAGEGFVVGRSDAACSFEPCGGAIYRNNTHNNNNNST